MNKDQTNLPLEQIQPGHVMAFFQYVKIDDCDTASQTLRGANIHNPSEGIEFSGKQMIQRAISADWYASEVKVNRSEAAEIIVNSGGRPFTVRFTKKDGTDRTLRGYFLGQDHLMGRSFVVDLDETYDANRNNKTSYEEEDRQVDHRTIQYVIFQGIKYTVKNAK